MFRMKEAQNIFEFVDLGTVAYVEAWDKQKQLVAKRQQRDKDIVLLCDHPSVITLGRLGNRDNLLLLDEIESRGIKVVDIDRGGDVTLHSPGQLVMYPIVDLRKYGKDLKIYLAKLEQVAIDFFKEFDILTERKQGKTGAWFGPKKIASIGIGVKRWIAFHGMSLNINTDLSLFSLIKPCGLDVKMTSLKMIKGEHIDFTRAKEILAKVFSNVFTRENSHV